MRIHRTPDEQREASRLTAARTIRLFGRRDRFTPSSGNVWRDLGFPDADERQAEANRLIAAMRAERERLALRPEYV